MGIKIACENVHWIQLHQDRVKGQALVDTVMKLSIEQGGGVLTS